jgi:hypothetical protein
MPIQWDEQVELDKETRRRMRQNETFSDGFYIYLYSPSRVLFIVLMIFMLGFIAGNIAHDELFHAIEQSVR